MLCINVWCCDESERIEVSCECLDLMQVTAECENDVTVDAWHDEFMDVSAEPVIQDMQVTAWCGQDMAVWLSYVCDIKKDWPEGLYLELLPAYIIFSCKAEEAKIAYVISSGSWTSTQK